MPASNGVSAFHPSSFSARARVEPRALELAVAERSELGLALHAGGLAELVEDVANRYLAAGRDVEGAADPGRASQRLGDVADVDVVTGRVAFAVEGRLLARPEAVAEDRDDPGLAMRALPRAVDVAQTADGMRDAVGGRPGADVGLAGPLRGAVGRDRRGREVLGGRDRRVVAVEGAAGRGVDDRCARRRPPP